MVLSLGIYGLDPQLLLKDNYQSSFLDVLEKSMKDDTITLGVELWTSEKIL
jgi:hypothetical protein